ncbi:MAG: response regulator transcription factor [Clostridiales bacterium]|nr:response regulator transcription factor [Clostridiales bacterium]
MYNVLVCDDEKDITSALKIFLETEGYRVFCAFNGRMAVESVLEDDIHLVLMDIMMPEMDGIEAMNEIRKSSNVPIILVSAKSETEDKLLGLDTGADDYITKPFNPDEVLARVRSQLRRYMALGGAAAYQSDTVLRIGEIELDTERETVKVDGEAVGLTKTEYDILKLFMRRPGEVISPEDIYNSVWHDAPYGARSTVAVHIRHIREKIEEFPDKPRYIKVIWGRGYRIEDDGGAS